MIVEYYYQTVGVLATIKSSINMQLIKSLPIVFSVRWLAFTFHQLQCRRKDTLSRPHIRFRMWLQGYLQRLLPDVSLKTVIDQIIVPNLLHFLPLQMLDPNHLLLDLHNLVSSLAGTGQLVTFYTRIVDVGIEGDSRFSCHLAKRLNLFSLYLVFGYQQRMRLRIHILKIAPFLILNGSGSSVTESLRSEAG